jgi:hypothetical protein
MVDLNRSSAERDDLPARTLLADVLPTFDLSEVHANWIPARPEKVFAAAKAVTAGEVRMLAPLEMVRGLPSIVGGHRPSSQIAKPPDRQVRARRHPLG